VTESRQSVELPYDAEATRNDAVYLIPNSLMPNSMRNYAYWLIALIAMLAFWSAVRAHFDHALAPETNACRSHLYWESPLLK